jgi:hypothetical protein
METVEEIKALLEDAKTADTNELIYKLERERNGANAHAVNKAIFYLNEFSKEGSKTRFIHNGKTDRLLHLKCDIIRALRTKDWRQLSRGWMSSWW